MAKGSGLARAVEVLQEGLVFVGVRTKRLQIYRRTLVLQNSFRFPEGKWGCFALQQVKAGKNNI